jgi:GH24 family phage-related lysozyme (muramidase)
MLTYKTLTTQEYTNTIVSLITGIEGHIANVKNIGDGKATIGYGYTFNRNDNVSLWQSTGITLSSGQWALLQRIDLAAAIQKTALGLQFDKPLTYQEAQTLLEYSYQKYESPANTLAMPESLERATLVSITYNRGAGAVATKMTDFYKAVNHGDRPEAWYEIRYDSQTSNPVMQPGIANRRYLEAFTFSLYNTNVSKVDAEQVAQMYALHKLDILSYEATYKPSAAVITLSNPAIQDIYHELQPAIDVLKAAYGIAKTVKLEEVQIASSTQPNLNGDGTIYDSAKNDADLLIGDNQANILDGGIGNDALIAKGGNDSLIGGIGNDTLIGSAGSDTLVGGLNDDTYRVRLGNILTENAGEGNDTVIITDNLLAVADFRNIEKLQLAATRTAPLTVELNQLTTITLSKNADDLTLHLNQNRSAATDVISIATGAGADTIHLTPQSANSNPLFNIIYANHLNFTDLAAGDKIDMSAFKVTQMVSDSTIIYSDASPGYYLTAPSSIIGIIPSPTQKATYDLYLKLYILGAISIAPTPLSSVFFQNTSTQDWQLIEIAGTQHTGGDTNLTLQGVPDVSYFSI